MKLLFSLLKYLIREIKDLNIKHEDIDHLKQKLLIIYTYFKPICPNYSTLYQGYIFYLSKKIA